MITHIATQEQKTPILFNIPDSNLDVGKPDPADTIFKREYDFSKIDYLFYYASGHLGGVNGTGEIKLYVGGTLKDTCTIPAAPTVVSYIIVDCTTITTVEYIEITIAQTAGAGGDELYLDALYLGAVDA